MKKSARLKKSTLTKAKAFTMMELMIVIAIIAVLSVVMTPKFKTARIEALNRGIEKNAENIIGVTENYLGRAIATTVTDALLKTELDKQGLKNPAAKNDAPYLIVSTLPIPTAQVKGCVYIVVKVGALTNIEGVDVVKVGADGSDLGTLKAGYN